MNVTMSAPVAMMGFNFMRMATIGLASLYMIHLLALDFMHIQKLFIIRPGTVGAMTAAATAARSLLFRSKRDLINFHSNVTTTTTTTNSADFNDFQKIEIDNITTILNDTTIKLNWNRILKNDPLNCIPLLTCQLIAGVENNSNEGKNIKNFIEFSYNSAPDNIQYAYNRGLIFSNKSEMCYTEYPFCLYSAKMMLRLLKIFIDLT